MNKTEQQNSKKFHEILKLKLTNNKTDLLKPGVIPVFLHWLGFRLYWFQNVDSFSDVNLQIKSFFKDVENF